MTDDRHLVQCPYCNHGTKTGPNGEQLRCVFCAGSGSLRITREEAKRWRLSVTNGERDPS